MTTSVTVYSDGGHPHRESGVARQPEAPYPAIPFVLLYKEYLIDSVCAVAAELGYNFSLSC